jgi:predicted metal-dependent enzyme (double-stranded beta helix superfamily)
VNSTTATRQELEKTVERTLDQVRSIEREDGIDRDSIARIQELLVDLTKRKDLFGEEQFPMPAPDKPAAIYLISADEGDRFALYLVCASPGTGSPPHDHTTWAVIAGLDGEEENRIWERVDDGSIPGKGQVKEVRQVVLRDGDGIAFLGDDIHSIKVVSERPTRHFHLYGKGFDQQTERVSYNVDSGSYRKMPTGMLPVDESRRIG